jgi:hypothetical protein
MRDCAMPIQVSIDKLQRLITSRCSGELQDDDLAEVQQRFDVDPDFSPNFSRIVDLTKVTGWQFSEGALNQWAASPNIDGAARRAVVCTKASIMTGVLDFIARARRHARDVSVFPDYDQAKRWIDKGETFER